VIMWENIVVNFLAVLTSSVKGDKSVDNSKYVLKGLNCGS